MSTLRKGDLVMHPVYKLLWVKQVKDDVLTCKPVSTKVTKTLRSIFAKEVTKATREQVEAYLKEKGWEKTSHGGRISRVNQYFIQPTDDSGFTVGLLGSHYENDFDTAPELLQEAILMARLLNATKD